MKRIRERVRRASEKFNRERLLKQKWLRQRLFQLTSNRQQQVVFVAGVQRSGTNMMMDILERSYSTEVFNEDDRRAFDNYELRDCETLHQLVTGSLAHTVVFKPLCNSQDIASLQRSFAPAKAVWIFRRYDDVVRSHICRWTEMPASVSQIANDPEATAGWRGRGMSPRIRKWVRKHHHESLSNASACAMFWYFRNILYFEQSLDRNPSTKLINYDRFVADPIKGTRDLFAFLGLDFKPSVCDFVTETRSSNSSETLDIDPPIQDACEKLYKQLQQSLDYY